VKINSNSVCVKTQKSTQRALGNKEIIFLKSLWKEWIGAILVLNQS